MFQKSEYKDLSSKYFFLISNKSAHSIKIYLTVITALHATQTGASSFLKMEQKGRGECDEKKACLANPLTTKDHIRAEGDFRKETYSWKDQ